MCIALPPCITHVYRALSLSRPVLFAMPINIIPEPVASIPEPVASSAGWLARKDGREATKEAAF